MKKWLFSAFLPILVDLVMEMVTSESLKMYADKLFDLIEEFVADTDTQVDDAIVLPIVQKFRDAFNIPDDD